jgi:hypothetical protein
VLELSFSEENRFGEHKALAKRENAENEGEDNDHGEVFFLCHQTGIVDIRKRFGIAIFLVIRT